MGPEEQAPAVPAPAAAPVNAMSSRELEALAELDPDRDRPVNVMESKDLCLRFGSKNILDNVQMAFRRGTITALIGPTGSGKSTFLRTLNRMNDKVVGFSHSGDVTLEESSIWSSN
jgi:phosphate transport system ATP-binding protein